MNTDERVQEALQSLPHLAEEVTITSLPTDVKEDELICAFVSSGCGCNKKCSSQFTVDIDKGGARGLETEVDHMITYRTCL